LVGWLARLILVIACAAAGAARAEDATYRPRATDDVLVYRTEAIVVEGEAEAEQTQPITVFEDTPVQREVLSREEVKSRPGTTAADLFRAMPGIRQQQRVQGEESAVSIDGLPPEFTRALVDGSRYQGEGGRVDDFSRIPLADAESVEILRGAQALRYGSEAAGGVVRIETPDPPRDGLRTRFDGGYGNADWIYGTGSAGFGNERAGGWLRFVHDQISGFGGPDDADAVPVSVGPHAERASRDVLGKFRLSPTDSIDLTTRLGWRADDESGLSSEAGVGDRDEHRWLVGQEIAWDVGEATRLEASFNWFRTELTSDVGRPFELVEREPSGRLALEHLLDTGPLSHALTVGFDVFAPTLELTESDGGIAFEDPDGPSEPVDERFALGGVYAVSETYVTEWLQFEGGLRAQFHTSYEPEFLPQIAMLVTPWRADATRMLRLRGSFGLGYRTPSLRDLYQPVAPQLGGAYFLVGNPDLEPEYVQSIRLGFEFVPLEKISLTATAFHNQIEDHIRSLADGSIQTGTELVSPPPLTPEQEQQCRDFGNALSFCNRDPIERPISGPLFRRANLDEVTTRGVETRIRLQPHPRTQFEAAYTYLETEVDSENTSLRELPNEPNHTVDLSAAFELPRIGTRVRAQARWRGEALRERSGTGQFAFVDPEPTNPSWTVDLRIVQPLRSGLELYADLLNVGDERVVDSYVVRGRTLFVGLRGAFD
jgi:outer membrane receptor protein involved in Fe transport